MKLRDLVRNKISSCKGNEKVVLNQKYKALRNQVNNLIRKENQEFNNKRITEANSEGELWKIANDVVKPKTNIFLIYKSIRT